jgi:hypothetical protein
LASDRTEKRKIIRCKRALPVRSQCQHADNPAVTHGRDLPKCRPGKERRQKRPNDNVDSRVVPHFPPTFPVTANVVATLTPTCASGGATANSMRAHVGSGLVARAKLAITWAVFRDASVLASVVAFTFVPDILKIGSPPWTTFEHFHPRSAEHARPETRD